MKRPLNAIRPWRAPDRHTGIDILPDIGVRYTYRHLENRQSPPPKAEVYRIETVIPFVEPTPFHLDIYFVPSDQLDEFFFGWNEHAAEVIDIRPMTTADAVAELEAFKTSVDDGWATLPTRNERRQRMRAIKEQR